MSHQSFSTFNFFLFIYFQIVIQLTFNTIYENPGPKTKNIIGEPIDLKFFLIITILRIEFKS